MYRPSTGTNTWLVTIWPGRISSDIRDSVRLRGPHRTEVAGNRGRRTGRNGPGCKDARWQPWRDRCPTRQVRQSVRQRIVQSVLAGRQRLGEGKRELCLAGVVAGWNDIPGVARLVYQPEGRLAAVVRIQAVDVDRTRETQDQAGRTRPQRIAPLELGANNPGWRSRPGPRTGPVCNCRRPAGPQTCRRCRSPWDHNRQAARPGYPHRRRRCNRRRDSGR